jgi:hypothetical protein
MEWDLLRIHASNSCLTVALYFLLSVSLSTGYGISLKSNVSRDEYFFQVIKIKPIFVFLFERW